MIKDFIKKVLRIPIQKIRRIKAKSAVTQLTSNDSPELKAIGEALQESLNHALSSEERELIQRIELRRSSLLGSNKEIAVLDYGAGDSASNRTSEEMEGGVASRALVADICKASKPAFWAILLFKMIRKLEPSSCVELGSCVGISASYQATALRLNGKGSLTTLEGSPEIARIAHETLESLDLQNASVVTGPFQETLETVLESSKPVDFFFNDGHHDHDAVLRYFEQALPSLSNDAVIVFDDISWSPGMRKAWLEIVDDKRVSASIDLRSIGIALLGNSSATREKIRIAL